MKKQKLAVISPDGEFYEVKDVDQFIVDLATDGITLEQIIKSQEFSISVKDSLEALVAKGSLEKSGNGSEEDALFDEARELLKILKQKLVVSIKSNPEEKK
jgi:hypothetical protein